MNRSFDPTVLEMMDRPQPVSPELERDLERIRQLNRWFGSYRVILDFIRRWIKPGAGIRIVDLATGSGDIPRLIVDYARKIGAHVDIDASLSAARAFSFSEMRDLAVRADWPNFGQKKFRFARQAIWLGG